MNKPTKKIFLANLLYCIMLVLLQTVPLLFADKKFEPYSLNWNLMLSGVETFVLIAPLAILLFSKAGREMLLELPHKKINWSILIAVPLGFCAYFAINGLSLLWLLVLKALGAVNLNNGIPLPTSLGQMGAGILVVGVVPALVEELFFRGVLLPSWSKIKPWVAIVATGGLFALMHGQVLALPAHFALGVLIGLVCYLTKNIWFGVIWHFMQNSIAVVIGYFSSTELFEQISNSPSQQQAMQIMENQPYMMAFSAASLIMVFGTGVIICLLGIYFSNLKKSKEPFGAPVCQSDQAIVAEKISLVAYAPLLASACFIISSYISDLFIVFGW